MSAPPVDEFLLRHAPGPMLEVEPELLQARASLEAAMESLRVVADADLERGWPWRADEADVRYGLYRAYEAIEEARADVRRILAADPPPEPPARQYVAAATAARWDLHGLLAGLGDDQLDRDPGNGEWTVRQTLAHIVSGQRGYAWGSAWWLARRDAAADDFPQYLPDDVASLLPDESTEAPGSPDDIRRRFDTVLDQTAGLFAGLDDDDLTVRARWSGIAVDIRFRLNRWASHIREHTIQVEKTLAIIGRQPSEVERVLRQVAAAYGRLEEDLYLRPGGGSANARAIAARALAAVAAEAPGVLSASHAERPAPASA